jgi:two-component SAPR family response regulator
MKVHRIKRKLEQLGANPVVTAERTNYGYHVKLRAQIGNYYDVEVSEGSRANSEREAIAEFLQLDSFIAIKPYHDESDPMSDYCAWSFPSH